MLDFAILLIKQHNSRLTMAKNMHHKRFYTAMNKQIIN